MRLSERNNKVWKEIEESNAVLSTGHLCGGGLFCFITKKGFSVRNTEPLFCKSHFKSNFQLELCAAVLLATCGFLVVISRFGLAEAFMPDAGGINTFAREIVGAAFGAAL